MLDPQLMLTGQLALLTIVIAPFGLAGVFLSLFLEGLHG